MKAILFLIAFSFLSAKGIAQSDHANQLANKIAQKMKDSLNLTSQQKNTIKDINLSLSDQKKVARQQHPGPSAVSYIQKIENTRDSLYKQILSADKYLLYKQKKRNLVNNN